MFNKNPLGLKIGWIFYLFDAFKIILYPVSELTEQIFPLKTPLEIKDTYLKQLKESCLKNWGRALIEALVILFIIKKFLFGLYYVPSGSAEPHLLVGDRVWGNKLVYYLQPVSRNDYVIFDNPTFDYSSQSASYLDSCKRWWQANVGLGIALLDIPAGPENVVKRVIGVPGDTIEGRIEKGKAVIYLNGERLDEPYVNTYPLVRVRKEIGFFSSRALSPFKVPDFLRRKTKKTYYTFDTTKSPDEQLFYKLEEHELIRNKKTGSLRIRKQPIYSMYDQEQSLDTFGPITIPAGKYWVMGDNRLNSSDSRSWGLLDEKLIRGRMSFVIYSIDTEEPIWIFELLKHPIDFWTKKLRWNRFLKSLGSL